MAVKTNKEFHALQHEMQMADQEIARLDDNDLELMLEGDEIAAAAKAADTGLKDAERSVKDERAQLEVDAREAVTRIETLGRERVEITKRISRDSLATFERVGKPRKGIAMSPLDGDLCSVCHVHVRPHIMQQVKRGEDVMQCENCQRILYFPPIVQAAPADGAA